MFEELFDGNCCFMINGNQGRHDYSLASFGFLACVVRWVWVIFPKVLGKHNKGLADFNIGVLFKNARYADVISI